MRALSSLGLAFDALHGVGKGFDSMNDECKAMVVALLAHGFTSAQISEFSQLPVSEVESMTEGDGPLVSDEVCAYISRRAHSASDALTRREARGEMRRRAKAMLGAGVSQAEVSRKFGMSRSWAYVIAREMGIAGQSRRGSRTFESELRRDAERVHRQTERKAIEDETMQLLNSGMSQLDVAAKVGRSQSWVSCVARSHGCIRRLSSADAKIRDEKIVGDAKEGVTVSELMDAYGMSRQNVLRVLREHGMGRRK